MNFSQLKAKCRILRVADEVKALSKSKAVDYNRLEYLRLELEEIRKTLRTDPIFARPTLPRLD
jgi:hypothetical protein